MCCCFHPTEESSFPLFYEQSGTRGEVICKGDPPAQWQILSHPKDRIPDDDKSSVVYKINCCDCDASYVGETGRALKTHVSEHRRAMEKRDFSASALVQHAWEHDHHIDWTSTYVLGVESHYQSRISREAIYIH